MKQTARIKLLSLLFVLSGLGAAFVLLKEAGVGNENTSNLKVWLDSSSLNKITLRYDSQTTVLTKGRRAWMVNGKYKTRLSILQLMIVGLSKAEVKRPVAEENKKKVRELLQKNGISVKAEGDGWNKNFLLASNDNDANSSYYMEEGSTEPYVIFVPGFSGDMANLFKMDEAAWRNRELFISTPVSLQKITVSYPAFKESNVSIQWNADKTFSIPGVKKVDSSKVINYLAQFEQVNVDQYVYKNKESIMAALRKNAPQAIIDVSDLDPAGNHTLTIYGESKEPKGIYAIVAPENELVVMKPETLFRLLVRKEFFEKKK